MKADTDLIKDFASKRLGDSVTAYEVKSYIADNCRVDKECFGGDAPWAQDLYDAWEEALSWRTDEAGELSQVLYGIGMGLYQVVANYTDTEQTAITLITSEVNGFRPGETYHGPDMAVTIKPE